VSWDGILLGDAAEAAVCAARGLRPKKEDFVYSENFHRKKHIGKKSATLKYCAIHMKIKKIMKQKLFWD
jgi:hypothetical protein